MYATIAWIALEIDRHRVETAERSWHELLGIARESVFRSTRSKKTPIRHRDLFMAEKDYA